MKPKNATKKAVRLLKKVRASTAVLVSTSRMTGPAYAADGVQGSKIVTGTEKLIGDVTTWLMVLAPVVAGLLII